MRYTLYSKPDCHLCNVMRTAVASLDPEARFEVIDINGDAQLQERFGIRIPVLEHAGEIVAEGRLDEAGFLDFLHENRQKATR